MKTEWCEVSGTDEFLSVEPDHGSHTTSAIVRPPAELDCSTARHLLRRMNATLRTSRFERVDVVLDQVEFIDAAGLRSLVECHQIARREGREVRLTRPSPAVERLVGLFGELAPLFSEEAS